MQSHSKVFVQQTHNFQRRQSKLIPSGKGVIFPLDCWKILRKVVLVRANHAFTEQFQKKGLASALAGLRHREVTLPCHWSQPSNSSLDHSASSFFISPSSFNAYLLK